MSEAQFEVELTQGAENDLEEIHTYLTVNRSPEDADALLDEFIDVIESLENFPLRGNVPEELDALGIREFRQVLLRQYRLIYRTTSTKVSIMVIADGRRDMQTLLERRLLQR